MAAVVFWAGGEWPQRRGDLPSLIRTVRLQPTQQLLALGLAAHTAKCSGRVEVEVVDGIRDALQALIPAEGRGSGPGGGACDECGDAGAWVGPTSLCPRRCIPTGIMVAGGHEGSWHSNRCAAPLVYLSASCT
jgi:hypothetical protein